jgi:hypothetical protein
MNLDSLFKHEAKPEFFEAIIWYENEIPGSHLVPPDPSRNFAGEKLCLRAQNGVVNCRHERNRDFGTNPPLAGK